MSMKTIKCPVRAIAFELRAAASDFDRYHLAWDEVETLEVRLQILPSGKWAVHSGSACYDADHSGVWGSTELATRRARDTRFSGAKDVAKVAPFDSMALAKELWNQAADMASEDNEIPAMVYAK